MIQTVRRKRCGDDWKPNELGMLSLMRVRSRDRVSSSTLRAEILVASLHVPAGLLGFSAITQFHGETGLEQGQIARLEALDADEFLAGTSFIAAVGQTSYK